MEQSSYIHLCQPGKDKSCAACCGLYNYVDSSREALTERLKNRTKIFSSIREPDLEELAKFSACLRSFEDQRRRYEVIYCCEFLGFLDEEMKRVGCLIHPFQNKGKDLREISFYGRELCAGHFCPSFHYLSPLEKKVVVDVLDDWYVYGLVVTDIDFVKEFFRHLSDAIGETPKEEAFQDDELKKLVKDYLELKINWPFRSEDAKRFGQFYFDGSQYMIKFIDYKSLGLERSRFDRMFLSLSSDFRSAEDVLRAEEIISHYIISFATTYVKKF
ncbi:MAG: hypothetical protein N2317_05215 [Syntrophales bacterium]|nr:hypothetical protein [Syntrophales bacterium]